MHELCAHFWGESEGVSRWMGRYLQGRVEGLRDQGRAPHRCPHWTRQEVVEAIVAVQQANPW